MESNNVYIDNEYMEDEEEIDVKQNVKIVIML